MHNSGRKHAAPCCKKPSQNDPEKLILEELKHVLDRNKQWNLKVVLMVNLNHRFSLDSAITFKISGSSDMTPTCGKRLNCGRKEMMTQAQRNWGEKTKKTQKKTPTKQNNHQKTKTKRIKQKKLKPLITQLIHCRSNFFSLQWLKTK